MFQTTENISLPQASSIDYRDADAIIAYARHLTAAMSADGQIEYPLSDAAALQPYMEQGAIWLKEVERNLSRLPIGKALPVLEEYDFMHRICLSAPPSEAFMERWWEKAYRAYRNGDLTVDASRLMAYLQRRLAVEPTSVTLPQLRWYCDTITFWCDHLRHADTFPDESAEENRRRIALLLNEDLSMHLGDRQAATKRRWRHHLIDASGTCV